MRVLPPTRLAAALVAANWNGAPLSLDQNQAAEMPQSPNGSMIFTWQNMSELNNDGTLALASGGAKPQTFDAGAGAIWPSILVRNWQTNNLTVTNISNAASTPIQIQAFGPGLPGQTVKQLVDGTPVPVQVLDTLTGIPDSNNMQLVFEFKSHLLALFAVIGGPRDSSGNNAYVIAVNFPAAATPPGYYGTTQQNSYTFKFSWNTRIWVGYFGAGTLLTQTAVAPTVTLVSVS
jgi:hypothetical protein